MWYLVEYHLWGEERQCAQCGKIKRKVELFATSLTLNFAALSSRIGRLRDGAIGAIDAIVDGFLMAGGERCDARS